MIIEMIHVILINFDKIMKKIKANKVLQKFMKNLVSVHGF